MNHTTKQNVIDFSDLEDSEFWDHGHPIDDPKNPAEKWENLNQAPVARYTEKCTDCRGTGDFHSYTGRYVGPCFKCKGTGELHFKTSPETRAKMRENSATKKAERIMNRKAETDQKVVEWKKANPEAFKWIIDNAASRFGESLLNGLNKYGSLTEKQLACVMGNVTKAPAAVTAQINVLDIKVKFDHAFQSGLKYPKLIVGQFTFTRATDHSKNPGHLYLKSGSTYLGKINPQGEFFKSRECTDEQVAELVKIGDDVLAAAKLHGLQTGRCSCCSRELTNPLSVELGIGPICRERWGM